MCKIASILWVTAVFASIALALSGSGTQADPWRIRSVADFNEFAADPNYWDDHIRLETDVNLAGITYTTAVIAPDTNSAESGFQGTSFTGVFDGNDHKIAGLTIDDGGSGVDCLGLFGYIVGGQVMNLGLESGSFKGDGYCIGSLAGASLGGTVENCYSIGDVTGVGRDGEVGGLVGHQDQGTFSNCHSAGDVNGADVVGGLVGYNSNGSIRECLSTSKVGGTAAAGGLVGMNIGSVTNCYSNGNVNGTSARYPAVGGFVGSNANGGSVRECYSTGDVSGTGDYVGGFAGWQWNGDILDCFWDRDTQTHGVTEGLGGGWGPLVPGRSTVSMQTKNTFTSAGWDFDEVWNLDCEGMNYPRLVWQVPVGDLACPNGVDYSDYSFFANRWMDANCGDNDDCEGADLDSSGTVNGADLEILVNHWLDGAGL